MAIIAVSLSQSVVTTNHDMQVAEGTDTFSEIVDLFFAAAYNFSTAHTYYSSASEAGTTLRINFPDGAYTNYYGVVLANPNASSGRATATGVDATWPSYYRLTYSGNLNYEYQDTSFHSTTDTISAAAIQTLLPSYSSSYDSRTGNAIISLQGSITSYEDGRFSGVVTTITGKAERFLDSITIGGSFKISGNGQSIGMNLATTSVSGTLSSYEERYRDGSYISATATTVPTTSNTVLDERIFADASSFPGNDSFSISLPGTMYQSWLISSGAGNDSITLQGGGGTLSANAGSGNDTIILKGASHAVDGGTGVDTVVLSRGKSNYSVTATGSGYTVTDKAGSDGTATLTNVERIQFADAKIALDMAGDPLASTLLTGSANAGQVYRLYQAAFDRQPDKTGLASWIGGADNGMPLVTIAQGFVTSWEFGLKYGNPSNHEYVDLLYQHVLHRPGEAGGLAYWYDQIDRNLQTRAQILVGFSDSTENQAAVIGAIQGGIDFTT